LKAPEQLSPVYISFQRETDDGEEEMFLNDFPKPEIMKVLEEPREGRVLVLSVSVYGDVGAPPMAGQQVAHVQFEGVPAAEEEGRECLLCFDPAEKTQFFWDPLGSDTVAARAFADEAVLEGYTARALEYPNVEELVMAQLWAEGVHELSGGISGLMCVFAAMAMGYMRSGDAPMRVARELTWVAENRPDMWCQVVRGMAVWMNKFVKEEAEMPAL
jgi:hypothetical protein